jgi:hypothetical protein
MLFLTNEARRKQHNRFFGLRISYSIRRDGSGQAAEVKKSVEVDLDRTRSGWERSLDTLEKRARNLSQ